MLNDEFGVMPRGTMPKKEMVLFLHISGDILA